MQIPWPVSLNILGDVTCIIIIIIFIVKGTSANTFWQVFLLTAIPAQSIIRHLLITSLLLWSSSYFS